MEQKTVIITLRPKLGLVPPAVSLLASIPEKSYYTHYGLRHPGGIFNVQFSKVARDVLDVARKVSNFSGRSDLDALVRAYTALLFSFVNFLESPYEILLGLCPPVTPPRPKEFVHRWLNSHGYKAGEKYFVSVEDDVKFFREFLNKLRHTSNTVRPLFITHESGQHIVAYYLEGADEQGAIGPDEKFHMRYEKRIAPNSFHRDLRRLFYCMYKVADVLKECLCEHNEQANGAALNFNDGYAADDRLYRELYGAIASLPLLYFSSEEGAAVPYPVLHEPADQPHLQFDFRAACALPAGRYSYSGGTEGDGFSRSFRMLGIGGTPIPGLT
jgi:hypothetical protein